MKLSQKMYISRFAKDDEAKDKRVASLEKELRDVNKRIEEVIQENSNRNNTNIVPTPTEKKEASKFCVIL